MESFRKRPWWEVQFLDSNAEPTPAPPPFSCTSNSSCFIARAFCRHHHHLNPNRHITNFNTTFCFRPTTSPLQAHNQTQHLQIHIPHFHQHHQRTSTAAAAVAGYHPSLHLPFGYKTTSLQLTTPLPPFSPHVQSPSPPVATAAAHVSRFCRRFCRWAPGSTQKHRQRSSAAVATNRKRDIARRTSSSCPRAAVPRRPRHVQAAGMPERRAAQSGLSGGLFWGFFHFR